MAKLPKIEGIDKGTLLRVPPSAYVINNEHNSRAKVTVGVKELMADLIAVGRQLQPVGFYQLEDGKLEVAYGARRAQAIAQIVADGLVPADHPLTKLEGIVIDRGTDAEVFERNVRENVARVNLSPMEEAAALDTLVVGHGRKVEDAARVFGKTKGWASQRMALLKLSNEAKKLVEKGVITASDGYELSKLDEGEQEKAVAQIQAAQNGTGDSASAKKAAKKAASKAAEESRADRGKQQKTFDRHSFEEELVNRKAEIENAADGKPVEGDSFGVQWEILDLLIRRMGLKVSSKKFFSELNRLIPA